jgi:nicotinamidase-related amidase
VCNSFVRGLHSISLQSPGYPGSPYGASNAFPPPALPEEFRDFETYLGKTHTVSRFCVPSSPGADILPTLAHLKQASHMEIVKTWYSSFTDTLLHEKLQSTNTTHLSIAGVTTNTCVAATSVHACRLGYAVTLVTYLVKAIKVESHDRAMHTLTNSHYNVSICTSDQVTKSLGTGTTLPTLYWANGSIPSWRVMLALAAKQIPYIAKRLRVMSKPKETRSAEFAQINSRCEAPTFVDSDGTVVIESLSILPNSKSGSSGYR